MAKAMRVVACLTGEHNLWLLSLAVVVCGSGAWAALELYHRARHRMERQRTGWLFLAAVTAGCSVWCTHFIAMLAYRNDVPASYEPLLTVASLIVVIAGAALAFRLALEGTTSLRLAGGLLLGLSVSAMHYLGMFAYRIDGFLAWDPLYVALSLVLAAGLSTLMLWSEARHRPVLAVVAFVACVLALHFTGMGALTVVPFGSLHEQGADFEGLAMALTCGALLIAATGVASHMIDSDVSEKAMDALREMALSDPLTGLPNRNSFTRFLDVKLARAKSEGRRFALVVIDFDKFKAVNDVHGHDGGDEMLRVLAHRLRGVLKDGEFLARMGGDEFAAVAPLPPGREVEGFIGRLESVLASPVRIGSCDVLPHASFGVSLYPQDGESPARILGNADLAMYRAKADPARGVSYYEPSMDEAARARRELVLELRRALERDEFELHYQLQARLQPSEGGPGGRSVIGYEALVRWRHPTRGYISPADFIPLAEESGLILPIGEWVLRTACREALSWSGSHRVAVNLSPVQIAHGNIPRLVSEVLEQSGLDPARLELEITETAIIEDRAHCIAALTDISALGVTVAIDDFGTGYSSLDALRAFPVQRIKLDRSFMRDIAGSPDALAILRAVLTLGRSLGIHVLAEGVETDEQLALLEAEGCLEVQGFLLGRPARQVSATVDICEPV
ncbi:putative bifunctional diguanylate cyclase/phosphodiesterase [Aquabacter cavernae]|uniref:putative bifunctional diguanylate cyclase/phosphodiesterase n=1 Tax=Aquabacter cavernae TaxID=2496029 RepID=UPI000F8DA26A|nr:EAL domain-containing protein [Aquabacter cavernae]